MFSGSSKNVCALAELKINRMLNTIDECKVNGVEPHYREALTENRSDPFYFSSPAAIRRISSALRSPESTVPGTRYLPIASPPMMTGS
jgi:hypothetical protein